MARSTFTNTGMALILTLAMLGSVNGEETELTEQAPIISSNDCRFPGSFVQEKALVGVSEPVTSHGRFLYDCEVGVIWEVQSPIVDALVLRLPDHANTNSKSRKSTAFRVVDDQVEPLKGRQSTFLTRLIMSLMSADRSALAAQFKIEQEAHGTFALVPKKRVLKRVLKQIKVTNMIQDDGSELMRITMLDRNSQATKISAQKETAVAQFSTQTCGQVDLSNKACSLLFPPNEPVVAP